MKNQINDDAGLDFVVITKGLGKSPNSICGDGGLETKNIQKNKRSVLGSHSLFLLQTYVYGLWFRYHLQDYTILHKLIEVQIAVLCAIAYKIHSK